MPFVSSSAILLVFRGEKRHSFTNNLETVFSEGQDQGVKSAWELVHPV